MTDQTKGTPGFTPGAECSHKHANPPIPDEDWKCPKCGRTAEDATGGFVIGDPVEGTNDCERLHEEDGVYCYGCDYATSGKAFARAVAKRRNLVKCEACKGSGFVEASPRHEDEERAR